MKKSTKNLIMDFAILIMITISGPKVSVDLSIPKNLSQKNITVAARSKSKWKESVSISSKMALICIWLWFGDSAMCGKPSFVTLAYWATLTI